MKLEDFYGTTIVSCTSSSQDIFSKFWLTWWQIFLSGPHKNDPKQAAEPLDMKLIFRFRGYLIRGERLLAAKCQEWVIYTPGLHQESDENTTAQNPQEKHGSTTPRCYCLHLTASEPQKGPGRLFSSGNVCCGEARREPQGGGQMVHADGDTVASIGSDGRGKGGRCLRDCPGDSTLMSPVLESDLFPQFNLFTDWFLSLLFVLWKCFILSQIL